MFGLSLKEVFSVTLILFSVIDILGAIPIIIDLRKKEGEIESGKATIVAGIIMFAFLFIGSSILSLFGVDVESFAVAGALIMFLLGLEMVLNIEIFKSEPEEERSTKSTIVPLAFPLLAGAGTMTTLISLRAEYERNNIIVGVIVNLIIVYIVLKLSGKIAEVIGKSGTMVLRKIFGIILIAIAIKLGKSNFIMPV
ncbi:membrane protein, MarC family [Bacteriovorax sp. BSW11_IV]|uniref:MarC family protein n=1 Tax=Bacteriovorax sp. BSW11_IV TaxID=1353529 RepID=UPI00038A08CE|nr:MarC family protein [Bacteriovorax sp. BSW11_IV]EQC42987.1 membrane protein, MarC family [Bacteriovorax sp. BSW11_IV]